MAYTEEYRNKKKELDAAGNPVGINTSGSMDSTTGPAAPTNQDSTPTSGFVNLQQYLDVNKGQGEKIAGAYTGDLNKKVDTFKTGTTKTVDDLKGKIDTAGTGYETAGTGVVADLNSKTTGDLSGATNFLNTGYAGPDTTETLANLGVEKKALNESLGQVDNTETQQAGLQSTFSKDNGNYGQGFGLLDRFLMTGDQVGRDAIAKTKGRSAEVTNAYTGAGTTLGTSTTAAKEKQDKAKSAIKTAAGTRRTGIEGSNFTDRIAAENAFSGDNEGAAGASIGDVITTDENAYLDALNSLAGGPAMTPYAKTFKLGTKKQLPTPSVAIPPAKLPEGVTTADVTGGKDNANFVSKALDFSGDPIGAFSTHGAEVTANDLQDQISMNNAAAANAAILEANKRAFEESNKAAQAAAQRAAYVPPSRLKIKTPKWR